MERDQKAWSAQNAKAKFSEVLDHVEEGREQVITRHGKIVAKIVPFDGRENVEQETGEVILNFLNASPLRNSGITLKRSGKVLLRPR